MCGVITIHDFHSYNYINISAVQTPGFSPPAPAPAKKTPAPGKKTPAPAENFQLRQIREISWKFNISKWKHCLCF